MAAESIQAMRKHLPPSDAIPCSLDVEGRCSVVFAGQRQDVDIVTFNGAVAAWQLAPFSFDAAVTAKPRNCGSAR